MIKFAQNFKGCMISSLQLCSCCALAISRMGKQHTHVMKKQLTSHVNPCCLPRLSGRCSHQPSYPTAPNSFITARGQGSLFSAAHSGIFPFYGSGLGALCMEHGTNQPGGTTGLSLQNRTITACYQDLLNFALPQHSNTLKGQATGHGVACC